MHPSVHVLEHISFVLAGLLVWTQNVDPSRHARVTPGGRAVFAGAGGRSYLTTTVSVSVFVSPRVIKFRSSGVWTFLAVNR
jgi:cytochrome c oxidase assembly factor CtaG